MDDREVFDKLLQVCANTTGAQDTFLKVIESVGGWDVVAVDAQQSEILIGSFAKESDADWHATISQVFPDVWRRLNAALDEADRADADRDSRECRIAELELEVASLRKELLIAG